MMPNFKKSFNVKIVLLIIASAFFLNNTTQGIELSNRSSLRKPLMLNDQGGTKRHYEARIELETIKQVLRQVLPSAMESKENAVEFIAVHFGNKWEEALSMMGSNLLDNSRWPFIERAQKAGLSITAMADLLQYRLDRIDPVLRQQKIEAFPNDFQELVLNHNMKRAVFIGTEARGAISVLWALYSLLWPDQHETDVLKDLREKKIDSLRFGTSCPVQFQKLYSKIASNIEYHKKNMTKESLCRLVIKTKLSIPHSDYLYLVSATVPKTPISVDLGDGTVFSGPLKLPQLKFSMKPPEENRMLDASKRKTGGLFTVKLIDFDLLARFPEDEKSGIRKNGLLGLIKYSVINEDTIFIELSQPLQRFPSSLDSLKQDIGSIDILLHEAFLQFASRQGFRRVLARTGIELFRSTQIEIHRNTVERVNNMYINLGYHIVFQGNKYHTNEWFWELELDNTNEPANTGDKARFAI